MRNYILITVLVLLSGCTFRVGNFRLWSIESTSVPDNVFNVFDANDVLEIPKGAELQALIDGKLVEVKAPSHMWAITDRWIEEVMRARFERE